MCPKAPVVTGQGGANTVALTDTGRLSPFPCSGGRTEVSCRSVVWNGCTRYMPYPGGRRLLLGPPPPPLLFLLCLSWTPCEKLRRTADDVQMRHGHSKHERDLSGTYQAEHCGTFAPQGGTFAGLCGGQSAICKRDVDGSTEVRAQIRARQH
jgi:hypothetical protein